MTISYRRRLIVGFSLFGVLTLVLFQATAQVAPTVTPSRVLLGWAGDTSTSMAVTWRTTSPAKSPVAQIAVAKASPALDDSASTVVARATTIALWGGGAATHYRAVFEKLQPSTRYVYRVGDGNTWTEWFTFSTAATQPEPFRFIYLGDDQNGLSDVWPRVVRAAYAAAPDARMIVHAGDLLAEGYDDKLWGEWTAGLSFIGASVPTLPVPGNHDLHRPLLGGNSGSEFAASSLWRAHFSLPANGPAGLPDLGGQNYYIDYQGVRFVAFDSNPYAYHSSDPERKRIEAAQVAWLRQILGNNPNRWTMVVQHHSLYPMSKDRDFPEMRAAIGALYDEFHVDLVLTGHDHVYARSHKVVAGRVVSPAAAGTIYALSVSGAKMYTASIKRDAMMAATHENAQCYQVIAAESGRLTYSSYGADGKVIDGFELAKSSNGPTVYTDRSPGARPSK